MRSRSPRPLALLLAVAAVLHVAWSLAVPALQEPDESSHFSYVQLVAERHEIPWPGADGPRGDIDRFSTEQAVAMIDGGLQQLLGNVAALPLRTEPDEDVWAARDAILDDDERRDIQPSSAFANPPAYYLYGAVVHEVAGGSFFDRAFVLRLANLPWVLLLVAAAWWLAAQLLPGRPAAVVLATGVVALQPLAASIAGGVGPDAMLAALGALTLAVAVRIAREGFDLRWLAALAGLCALSALTHGRGIAVVLPAAVAVLLALRGRLAGRAWRAVLGGAAVVGLAGLVFAVRYAQDSALTMDGTRGFLSYLWQFYLPALPGMDDPPFVGWTVRDVFVDRFYGTFGQLDITVAPWVTDAVAAGGWVLLAGVVAVLARHRDAVRRRGPALLVIVAAIIGTLGLTHAQAYRGLLDVPDDPVMTGRYLLPLLPVLGVAVASVLTALPRRAFAIAGGGVLGVAVLLHAAALGAMWVRFDA